MAQQMHDWPRREVLLRWLAQPLFRERLQELTSVAHFAVQLCLQRARQLALRQLPEAISGVATDADRVGLNCGSRRTVPPRVAPGSKKPFNV